MPESQDIPDVQLIGPAELRLLKDPLREGIVHATVNQTQTAGALAARLGVPVTRLYYHLDLLVRHGLLRVDRIRRVNGLRERHYRACARQLRLDRAAFSSPVAGDAALESILEHVFDQARLDIARAAGAGRIATDAPFDAGNGLVAWRMVLALDAAERRRWARRLRRLYDDLERLAQRGGDGHADRQLYAVTLALYPSNPDPAS